MLHKAVTYLSFSGIPDTTNRLSEKNNPPSDTLIGFFLSGDTWDILCGKSTN